MITHGRDAPIFKAHSRLRWSSDTSRILSRSPKELHFSRAAAGLNIATPTCSTSSR
jgi:hypothetical protein